jgi:hypothetical protein
MFTLKSLRQMVFDQMSTYEITGSVGIDKRRYAAAKSEILRVSTFEGFREQPATEIEIALGFFCFVLWNLEGIKLNDPAFGQMANETARIVSINFISALRNAPEIVSSIRRRVPSFDPPTEVGLATEKGNGKFWKTCLTRAVIMVCRSLAYEATGLMGGQLELPQNMNMKEMGLVAYCLLAEALDKETAATIVAPLGIL